MKINRFVGLAAIALLVVSAMEAVAALAFAQPLPQTQTRAAVQVNQLPAAQVNQPVAQVNQPPVQPTLPAAQPAESLTILEAGTLTETTTETGTGATEPITDTVGGGPNDQAGGNDQAGANDQIGGNDQAGPNDQSPKLNGSITVTQTATDGQSETAEAAALAPLAKITVDQAKTAALAANANTTVTSASLEDENGTLIYSVVLSNGLDVKMDAGNGAILQTDANADSQGQN